MKSHKMLVSFGLNLHINIIIFLYWDFVIVSSEKIVWLNRMKVKKLSNLIKNVNYEIWIKNDKIL